MALLQYKLLLLGTHAEIKLIWKFKEMCKTGKNQKSKWFFKW